MIKPEKLKFTGYRRPDGRFGIRNHVIILPVDDISNAAAEGVAHLVKGTMALPHPYGRLQFGEDLDLTFRTLAGIGRNPHIAAAVVIGIEPKWTERIAKEIRKTGKPVAGFGIERHWVTPRSGGGVNPPTHHQRRSLEVEFRKRPKEAGAKPPG